MPEEQGDSLRPAPVRRCGEPIGHLVEEMHVSRSPFAGLAVRAHGTATRWAPTSNRSGDRRQDDGKNETDDDRRVVADGEAVGDLLAEAPEADERRHRHQPDDGGRGHPNAGEDVRQSEGEVDPDEGGGGRVAQCNRRLPGVGRDGVEAGHGVPDQDEQACTRPMRSRPSGRKPRNRSAVRE